MQRAMRCALARRVLLYARMRYVQRAMDAAWAAVKETERLDAALRIQGTFRAKQVSDMVRRMEAEAEGMAEAMMEAMDKALRVVAALAIQESFRSTRIQRMIRDMQLRVEAVILRCSVLVQRLARGHRGRMQAKAIRVRRELVRLASTKMQGYARMRIARKRFVAWREAAIVLTVWWRFSTFRIKRRLARRRILQRWHAKRRGLLETTVATWRENAYLYIQMREDEALAEKLLVARDHYEGKLKRKSVDGFILRRDHMRVEKEMLRKALRMWELRNFRMVLHCWRDNVHIRVEHRHRLVDTFLQCVEGVAPLNSTQHRAQVKIALDHEGGILKRIVMARFRIALRDRAILSGIADRHCAALFAHRQPRHCLNIWDVYVARKRHWRAMQAAAVEFHARSIKSVALLGWHNMIVEWHRRRGLMLAAVLHCRARTRRLVWRGWLDRSGELGDEKRKAAEANRLYRDGLKRKVCGWWRGGVATQKMDRAALAKAMLFMKHRLTRKIIFNWHPWAVLQRETREYKAAVAVQRMIRGRNARRWHVKERLRAKYAYDTRVEKETDIVELGALELERRLKKAGLVILMLYVPWGMDAPRHRQMSRSLAKAAIYAKDLRDPEWLFGPEDTREPDWGRGATHDLFAEARLRGDDDDGDGFIGEGEHGGTILHGKGLSLCRVDVTGSSGYGKSVGLTLGLPPGDSIDGDSFPTLRVYWHGRGAAYSDTWARVCREINFDTRVEGQPRASKERIVEFIAGCLREIQALREEAAVEVQRRFRGARVKKRVGAILERRRQEKTAASRPRTADADAEEEGAGGKKKKKRRKGGLSFEQEEARRKADEARKSGKRLTLEERAPHLFPNAPLCGDCLTQLATWECKGCTEAGAGLGGSSEAIYCDGCFNKMHRQGSWMEHDAIGVDFAALDRGNDACMCAHCEVTQAERYCEQCTDALCRPCYLESHGRGLTLGHTWQPTHRTLEDGTVVGRGGGYAGGTKGGGALDVVERNNWTTWQILEDARLAKEEAKAALAAELDRHRKNLRFAFDMYDTDESGYLDRDELHNMLTVELCMPINEKKLDQAIAMMDENGDGEIEFEELLNWFALTFIPGRTMNAQERMLVLRLKAGKLYWKMRKAMAVADQLVQKYKDWRYQTSHFVPGKEISLIDIESYPKLIGPFRRWCIEEHGFEPPKSTELQEGRAEVAFEKKFVPLWNEGKLRNRLYYDRRRFEHDGHQWEQVWDENKQQFYYELLPDSEEEDIEDYGKMSKKEAKQTRAKKRRESIAIGYKDTAKAKKYAEGKMTKKQRADADAAAAFIALTTGGGADADSESEDPSDSSSDDEWTKTKKAEAAAIKAKKEEDAKRPIFSWANPRTRARVLDRVVAAFAKYDTQRWGFISAEHLRPMLQHELCEPCTTLDAEVLQRELDTDRSGKIYFNNFLEWYTIQVDEGGDHWEARTHKKFVAQRGKLRLANVARLGWKAAYRQFKRARRTVRSMRKKMKEWKAEPGTKVLMEAGYPRRAAEGALRKNNQSIDQAQDFLDANPDYQGEFGAMRTKVRAVKTAVKAKKDAVHQKALATYKEKYGNAAVGNYGMKTVEIMSDVSDPTRGGGGGAGGGASGALSMLATDLPAMPYEYKMVEMNFSIARLDRIGSRRGAMEALLKKKKASAAATEAEGNRPAADETVRGKIGSDSDSGSGSDSDSGQDDEHAGKSWQDKPMPETVGEKNFDPKTASKNVGSSIKDAKISRAARKRGNSVQAGGFTKFGGKAEDKQSAVCHRCGEGGHMGYQCTKADNKGPQKTWRDRD